jgi:hypothetical protein
MPLQCNIDNRGKLARFLYGLVLLIIGVALACLWAHLCGSVVRWIIAIGCMLGGAFALFEARAGWCIVRAMGWRTPM